jgi:hypothetical protein
MYLDYHTVALPFFITVEMGDRDHKLAIITIKHQLNWGGGTNIVFSPLHLKKVEGYMLLSGPPVPMLLLLYHLSLDHPCKILLLTAK